MTGHFQARMGALREHPGTKSQAALKWNDAIWVGRRRLWVLERAKSTAVLREVSLDDVTNLLADPRENDSALDTDDDTVLKGFNVAESRLVAGLDPGSRAGGHKLEALCLGGPRRLAVMHDNDFGIGENEAGIPTRFGIVWRP